MSGLEAKVSQSFFAAREAGFVQVFGCRREGPIHPLRRPASEKRQGTKSRLVGHWLAASAMGIWGVAFHAVHQQTDPPHPVSLLRPRR
jgi:hypothetical protein